MHGPTCIVWASLTALSLQHDITLEARRTFRFAKVVVCFFTMFRVTTVEPRLIYTLLHYVNKLGFAAFFAFDTQFWVYRHMNLASKVRKTPCRPRNWATFSPL